MKPFFTLLLALLISACATINKTTDIAHDLPWQSRLAQSQAINSWDLQGVMSISTEEQSFSAHYYWIQATDSYTISLYGPLGVGAIKLEGTKEQVILTNNDGNKYLADNPEQLMQQTVGWSLPMSDLIFWIRGIPSELPITSSKFDNYHRLSSLEQEGWQIDYQQYQLVDNIELPKKITLTRSGLKVVIIIQQWKM